MTGTPIGLYQPGSSVLHRLPAGIKVIGLLAGAITLTVLRSPLWSGLMVLVVAALYALAGIGRRTALAQVWPMRWLLVFIGTMQCWLSGWQAALSICLSLLGGVALAGLITLTTRVSAMLDLTSKVMTPLRRTGIDPDRVGLVLALTIRCVPLLVGIVAEVNLARRARGVGFSVVALVAPAVVRALRTADALGDALVARGADD